MKIYYTFMLCLMITFAFAYGLPELRKAGKEWLMLFAIAFHVPWLLLLLFVMQKLGWTA